MISSVRPLYAGNALQLTLAPPTGALLWRVLRKAADDFTGADDAAALVAFEGNATRFIDAEPGLENEIPAFYRAYYSTDGAAWTASATASGVPLATYEDHSTDAMSVVRNRIDAGLAVEVGRGILSPASEVARISVLTAPPAAEMVSLPAVTVHLSDESPSERVLGEMIDGDSRLVDGRWVEHEGWMAAVKLEIVVWSLNPDERIALRKAVRRILVANLQVFDEAGMTEIEFSASDIDAVNGEYAANVYQTMFSFSCLAPVIVSSKVNAISDVLVNVIAEVPPVN